MCIYLNFLEELTWFISCFWYEHVYWLSERRWRLDLGMDFKLLQRLALPSRFTKFMEALIVCLLLIHGKMIMFLCQITFLPLSYVTLQKKHAIFFYVKILPLSYLQALPNPSKEACYIFLCQLFPMFWLLFGSLDNLVAPDRPCHSW